MDWDLMLSDLESSFDAERRADLVAQSAELAEAEHASIEVVDRLRGSVGRLIHLRTRGGQAVDALQDTLGRPGGCQDRAVDIEGDEDLGGVGGKPGGQGGLGLVAQDREGPRSLPGGGNRQEALLGHHATGTRTSSPPR